VTNKLADAAIEQLNLSYDSLQDRLILRLGLVDHTEIKVWLTRRMVKALWGMLQGLSIVPISAPDVFNASTQQALDDFAASQKELQKMDFSETYQANRKSITDAPMLPSDFRIIDNKDEKYVLELQSTERQTVRIPLNQEITNALVNMLQMVTRDAQWDLSLSVSHVVIASPSTQPVLH
jgi:hypothetical protein